MQKTILITGATDGIGFETAKMLLENGHHVLLHGRSQNKMDKVEAKLAKIAGDGGVESYIADLSDMKDVDKLALDVKTKHNKLDVLINNAGVLKTGNTITKEELDVRFVVNTLAPHRLTSLLMPILDTTSRVINLSSAAQATVNTDALKGKIALSDMEAYAQSKLAITMLSINLANQANAPVVIAVNPGSMLGTKMVKEGFGAEGGDIGIGARILCQTALDDEFANATGQYFDNDIGRLGAPHPDALDTAKRDSVVGAINDVLAKLA